MKPSENFQRRFGALLLAIPILVLGYQSFSFGIYGNAIFLIGSLLSLALFQAPHFLRVVPSAFVFLLLSCYWGYEASWQVIAYVGLSSLMLWMSARSSRQLRPHFLMIAIAIWIAILGRASGPEGGADPLREFLMRYLPSESSVEFAVIAIRKSIHFVFYGIMAAMAYLSQDRETRSSKTIITVSLFVVLCEAILDEVRQSQFANRTGSAWDVVLDLAGAVFALRLMNRRDKKPTESVLS